MPINEQKSMQSTHINYGYDLWANHTFEVIKQECQKHLYSNEVLYNGFEILCKHGRLEEAKWLLSHRKEIPDYYFDTNGQRVDCVKIYQVKPDYVIIYRIIQSKQIESKQLEIIKWLVNDVKLFEPGNFQLNGFHYSFLLAIRYGYLEIAKFLYSYEKYDEMKKNSYDDSEINKTPKSILIEEAQKYPIRNREMKIWINSIIST